MRGIDKKACRNYLEPLTAPSSDCGLFLVPKIEFVIRTAVKIIGHRRVLVLCLYARGDGRPVLTYTMFQTSDGFITFDHRPEGKTHWRTAMLNNLGSGYRFSEDKCAFYSRPDEQRVLNFCGNHEIGGADALYRLQKKIRDAETAQRVRRRQKKVVREFKALRPLPKGVAGWLQREVLPAYFYYDYRKGAKRVRGVCSACGQESELEGVRHNGEGVCPRCGRKFTMKSNKKRGYLWDRETASVVQKLRENELVVRVLKVYRVHRRGEQARVGYYEETRIVVRRDGSGRYKGFPYHYDHYNCVLTHWKTGYPPVCYMYGQNYSAETCGHLYCGNLDRELKGTPWEYCQLGAFYHVMQDQMEVTPYLEEYSRTPALEYFVKLKLFWLASQIVYRGNSKNGEKLVNLDGKNLRDILQIDPGDLPWLQRPTSGVRDLLLLRILRREGQQPSGEFFAWLDAHDISETDCFALALRYTTPHRLTRYLDEQFAKHDLSRYPGIGGILSDYKDYLSFCEELHYDMKNEFVLFPKRLKEAHDQARSRIKQKQVEQYDAQIAAMRDALTRKYRFSADGLVVLPPRSAQEIVVEGQKLHHCVGGYAQRMAEDKCTILFIRKEEQRERPFYTVEVRGEKIIQVRGRNNYAPTEEVEAFLDTWKRKKHLTEAA